ncbi:LOW QUALITY PROTEIN: isochorismatase domain-containing protein 1 [Ailuropoda melanoleuca]|nr:LOW QUALITY PROTEIN: isochorismatase domain-containing protein 1 [Ailuropoda melanoleuca]
MVLRRRHSHETCRKKLTDDLDKSSIAKYALGTESPLAENHHSGAIGHPLLPRSFEGVRSAGEVGTTGLRRALDAPRGRPARSRLEGAVPAAGAGAALPNSGGAGAPSGTVPVLFCFSVFARPSSVPHGAGYELLIQKFLSLYGDQIDMHRKFVVQLFAEEWGQYVDLPKGFAVSERCKVRLVPLQIQLTTLGNLTPSSTVFFCCDMQERFRPAIKYFGDIISVGQRLLQGARMLGIPVIVTEQYPKGLGSTVQEIDLTGVKLVLPKTRFSMVIPEVEAALAEIPGVRSVVLFGVETHVCIQQTALELVGRGIEVHIVADATSSRSMMDRMFALERLARTGIIVTTSEAVLLQLVADKDHPKFKEIQNLIKASAPESGLLSKV